MADAAPQAGTSNLPAPNVKEVLALLWQRVSFRHLSFAAGLHAFVGYGAGTWNAPFLIRSHDMPVTEVGTMDYWSGPGPFTQQPKSGWHPTQVLPSSSLRS